ncbi:hypothetical protein D3C86_2071630 [compost metagenome]
MTKDSAGLELHPHPFPIAIPKMPVASAYTGGDDSHQRVVWIKLRNLHFGDGYTPPDALNLGCFH